MKKGMSKDRRGEGGGGGPYWEERMLGYVSLQYKMEVEHRFWDVPPLEVRNLKRKIICGRRGEETRR